MSAPARCTRRRALTGMMKGKHAPDDQQSMDVGEQGVCDQLQQEVPGVIEVRMSDAGSFEYREMRLGGTTDEAQWIAFTDTETAAGGWRPAVNFLQMNFTPPLSSALSDDYFNYIAYAPAPSVRGRERSQLVDGHQFRQNGRNLQLVRATVQLRRYTRAAVFPRCLVRSQQRHYLHRDRTGASRPARVAIVRRR